MNEHGAQPPCVQAAQTDRWTGSAPSRGLCGRFHAATRLLLCGALVAGLGWPGFDGLLAQSGTPQEPTAGTLPPGVTAEALARWRAMSEAEREAFREKHRRFERLPPETQALLRERLQRYRSLPPARQQQLREQLRQFRQLSPEERQSIRQAFRRYQELPRYQRERLRELLQQVHRMPAARRFELLRNMRRWQQMTPEERQQMRVKYREWWLKHRDR